MTGARSRRRWRERPPARGLPAHSHTMLRSAALLFMRVYSWYRTPDLTIPHYCDNTVDTHLPEIYGPFITAYIVVYPLPPTPRINGSDWNTINNTLGV